MKDHMGNNKALGLLAQAEFERWARSNASIRSKYFDGYWVASPKGFTATRRICFFVHRQIERNGSVDSCIDSILSTRGFHALFGSISRSGLGVLYCIPTNEGGTGLDELNWRMFRYQNETLREIDPFSEFPIEDTDYLITVNNQNRPEDVYIPGRKYRRKWKLVDNMSHFTIDRTFRTGVLTVRELIELDGAESS